MSAIATPGFSGTFTNISNGERIAGNFYSVKVQLPASFNNSIYGNMTLYSVGGLTNTSTRIVINVTTNITNSSGTPIALWNRTLSFNTLAIEDANDYNISVMFINSTGQEYMFNNLTRIIIDNTNPAAPTGLTSAEQTVEDFTISATVTNAVTTNCRIDWIGISPVSGVDARVATTTTTCSFPISDASDGEYTYIIYASDENNETQSANQKISINTESGTRPPITPTVENNPVSGAGIKGLLGSIISWIMSLFS